MKAPIAKFMIETAHAVGAAATLREARLTFGNLREVTPGIWQAAVHDWHIQQTVDLRLSFVESHLAKALVSTTLNDDPDGIRAFNGLRIGLSEKYGPPARWKATVADSGRQWALRHEMLTIQKRRGESTIQLELVRTFDQPNAAADAPRSLIDLFEPVTSPVRTPASAKWSRPVFEPLKASEKPRPIVTYAKGVTMPGYPRIRAEGPYCPKWRPGRRKPLIRPSVSDGPIHFQCSSSVEGRYPTRQLEATVSAFDSLATRSDWEPFSDIDTDTERYPSSWWWWLGGGAMINVYVREWSLFDLTSTLFIHAYHQLDAPPAWAVRPAPTQDEVRRLINRASELTETCLRTGESRLPEEAL